MTQNASKVVLSVIVVASLLMSGTYVVFSLNGIDTGGHLQGDATPYSVGGIRAVEITIYNNQTAPTPAPFQQELTVNSAIYMNHESYNLSNVEFQYLNGTVIPSWLESGNTSSSSSTVYWLKLSSGIPADSNLSIYMIFLPKNEIAFNGVSTGEAAQFSGAPGTAGFGRYNNIAHVMDPGLIFQIFANTTNSPYTPTQQMVVNALIFPNQAIPSSGLFSSTPPFTTAVTGSFQDVHGQLQDNAIIDYQYSYQGGSAFPNPPVSNPSYKFLIKTIGWTNVQKQGTTLTAVSDDAIMAGSGTTGGNSSGYGWLSLSKGLNIIGSGWRSESATYYTGNMNTGTTRLMLGYDNTGGPAMFGVYTNNPIQYYHAAPPPNAVMPAVSFSSVHTVYFVSMLQTGIAGNNLWSMQITGHSSKTANATSSIVFPLSNGTYSYALSSVNKIYAPNAYTGTITVSGSPLNLIFFFHTILYNVYFNESKSSKLPLGTSWTVSLSGADSYSASTSSNNTSIQMHNGTYAAYFSSALNSEYMASGFSLTISGTHANFTVDFKSSFGIRFNETGLPVGTRWYVNFSNFVPFTSTTNVTQSYQINGTYSYTIATVDKRYAASGGSVTVNGAAQNVSVTFNPVLYTVTFDISGFPSPEQWYINITQNLSINGTGASGSMQLMNGTYFYVPATTYKIFHSPKGTLKVKGSPLTIDIVFSPYQYNINFTESNLGSGVEWYVNVSNVSYYTSPFTVYLQSRGSYINSLNLTNGSYSFTLESANKIYAPVSHLTNFTVSGSSLTFNAAFYVYTYKINVSEIGLPAGTSWYLYGGATGERPLGYYNATSPVLEMMLHNGTYTFTPGTDNTSYSPFLSSITFIVVGSDANFTVNFLAKQSQVAISIGNLPSSVSTWYLNISNDETIVVHGQSVSFSLPYGSYSYTITVSGHGIVYAGVLNLNSPTVNIEINLTQNLAQPSAINPHVVFESFQSFENMYTKEVIL